MGSARLITGAGGVAGLSEAAALGDGGGCIKSDWGKSMIDLYYWTTPNGHKITLFLEEAGFPTRSCRSISAKANNLRRIFWRFRPITAFRRSSTTTRRVAARRSRCSNPAPFCSISPRRPANFCSPDLRGRVETLEWLFWQMGGLGPMAGPESSFQQICAGKNPLRDRSLCEGDQPPLWRARQAACGPSFVAGDYSIADMAIYPWIVPHEMQGQDLADFPHLKRLVRDDRAPGRRRSAPMRSRRSINTQPTVADDEARKILFGQTARR